MGVGNTQKEKLENIIWIDPDIENYENKDYSEKLEKLNLLKYKFVNIEDALKCISEIKFKEVKIIISGKLYKKFVESFKQNIKEMYVAPKIIIFTSNTGKEYIFDQNFKKEDNKFYTFGGIATSYKEVENFLLNKSEPEKFDKIETNEDELTFDYIDTNEKLLLPLFFKGLIESKKEDSNKYNLSLYETYIERKLEPKGETIPAQKLIKILRSKSNIPDEILSKYYVRLYTFESNFYYDINKDLRQKTREKHLPFIKTLYEGIKLNALDPYKEDEPLYRGSLIKNSEIEKIKEYLKIKNPNLPGAIAFSRTFLSFSKKESEAENFLTRSKFKEGFSKVKYILMSDRNSGYNLSTHCDIKNITYHPKEEEVLFLPFSCFEIKDNIKDKNDNGNMTYEITLLYLGKYLKKIKDDQNLYLDEKILPDSDFKKQLAEFGLIKNIENKKTIELIDSFDLYSNIFDGNNAITGQIEIELNDINKDIQIINSFENAKKVANENYSDELNYQNESDIQDNIQIRIDGKLIEFSYFYQFEKKGKYTIKYSFKKDLTKINHLFYNCSNLTKLDFSNCILNNLTNICNIFNGCSKLEDLKISNLKTQNVTDMNGMFYNCYCLPKIDLTKFNTEKVTNMNRMFYNCYKLKDINLLSFDTKNVIDMSYMFNSCSSLESLNLTNFNTEKVTNMSYMFNNCSKLKSLNLANFRTSNVISMDNMFYSCEKLSNLDLSKFDTIKVKKIKNMFFGCSLLNKDKINTKDKKI